MAKNDRTTAGPYWTRNWIEKMWRFTAENFVDFDTGAVDFEALGREEYEFRKALFYRKFKNSERAREAFVESEDLYKVNVERGKKGGRPRKNQEEEQTRAGADSLRRVAKVSTPPASSAGPMPEDKQAVYDFAAAEGLDTADAYECWHVTVNERNGLTADGKPIKNWKAYVRKWCETRAGRRKTAK